MIRAFIRPAVLGFGFALTLSSAAFAFQQGDMVLVRADNIIHKAIVLDAKGDVYHTSASPDTLVEGKDLQAYVGLAQITVKSLSQKVIGTVMTSEGTTFKVGELAIANLASVSTLVRVLDITSTGLVLTTHIDSYFSAEELTPLPDEDQSAHDPHEVHLPKDL